MTQTKNKPTMEVDGLASSGTRKVEMNFPSNSNKAKMKSEKNLKKVIKGGLVEKKKSLLIRFLNLFFEGDLSSIAEYAIKDILIPSSKETIFKMLNGSLEKLFYKDSRPRSSTPVYSGPIINYGGFSNKPTSYSSDRADGYRDLILDNPGDCEEVINNLLEQISAYGLASVGDLYSLVGMDSDNYTNYNYGWKNLSDARVKRVPDGYMISLPKPIPLD